MSETSSILKLPDLALHTVCSYLTNPFDLLRFGNTCTKLRRIASAQSLWWNISTKWFSGLWLGLDTRKIVDTDDPRKGFLTIIHDFALLQRSTRRQCFYEKDEEWERVDSPLFRCIVTMLQKSYTNIFKESHPCVLYEQYVYDVGLYHRKNPSLKFDKKEYLSRQTILELSLLGQAKERDLRGRKQPHIDPTYYIKVMNTSHDNWTNELFPIGFHGSICPLLMCPFQSSFPNEISGVSGLSMCASMALEKYIFPYFRTTTLSLHRVSIMMKSILDHFYFFLVENTPKMKEKWGTYCFANGIQHMASGGDIFDISPLQEALNELPVHINACNLIKDIYNLIVFHGGIDNVVDSVRRKWRCALMSEIYKVLFPVSSKEISVTRINLTDSDLIGGDNARQEMSSAAFITPYGVLVVWHLTGRLRY